MDSQHEAQEENRCIAFEGDRRIATGQIREVAEHVKATVDRGEEGPILIFDCQSSHAVELDLRGTLEEVLRRLDDTPSVTEPCCAPTVEDAPQPSSASRGRGRPRLGVVGREVTLLPRHWQWLASQPGSASVTLRKLVDRARRESVDADRRRKAQESAYRFMTAMAGNQPGFEEATRALFASDTSAFEHCSQAWPSDVRDHSRILAGPALVSTGSEKP